MADERRVLDNPLLGLAEGAIFLVEILPLLKLELLRARTIRHSTGDRVRAQNTAVKEAMENSQQTREIPATQPVKISPEINARKRIMKHLLHVTLNLVFRQWPQVKFFRNTCDALKERLQHSVLSQFVRVQRPD